MCLTIEDCKINKNAAKFQAEWDFVNEQYDYALKLHANTKEYWRGRREALRIIYAILELPIAVN